MAAAVARGDEEVRMQQSEIDLLERYEDGLKGRCWTFLKVDEMGALCDEMDKIGGMFSRLTKSQRKVF
jgi:hypothetical protein